MSHSLRLMGSIVADIVARRAIVFALFKNIFNHMAGTFSEPMEPLIFLAGVFAGLVLAWAIRSDARAAEKRRQLRRHRGSK